MLSNELKLDWLYRLKRKTLFIILGLLTLSIVSTMYFIADTLEKSLIEDSRQKTHELAVTIDSNLHHMMILRARDAIQKTLEHMVETNESISRTFVINNEGVITYSSNKDDVGTKMDRNTDSSCNICHNEENTPHETDTILLIDNGSTHRNISLIYNEHDCQVCHDPAEATIGKLVIDRSRADTFALIDDVEFILIASGFICLIILIPLLSKFLSRGIDQYILEIFTRNEELRLLYVMVERLSKTLDVVLLKEIVVEIFKDILDADEVDLILGKGDNEYSASVWTRETGQLERCGVEENKVLAQNLKRWLNDELTETTIAEEKNVLSMPIQKGSNRLALITVRKHKGVFDSKRLKLCNVIASHVTVAFDNARLYYIAITDELTKIFTKRHFRQCIDSTFSEYEKYGTRFALMMMDLDHFKSVNDTHGHVVGDSVLQKLGDIIKQSIRENDLPFRYGGEEFSVILPDTSEKGARYVAERIRSATEEMVFEPGTIDLKLTISIGISTCPRAPSIRDLIVAADKALYQAKSQGRNKFVVSDMVFDSAEPAEEEESTV